MLEKILISCGDIPVTFLIDLRIGKHATAIELFIQSPLKWLNWQQYHNKTDIWFNSKRLSALC